MIATPGGTGPARRWVPVCRLDDMVVGRGVCALVDGRAVALFRLEDRELAAIGNEDPFTGASVLSRGIVGSTTEGERTVRFVASPLRKHRFDLSDGRSLDDPDTCVGSWPVRCEGDIVVVAVDPHPGITTA